MLHQEMGERYPQMQWFSNHLRLACATMFTLFFGGNDFAPGIEVAGEPIQDFLQGRYIEAFGMLAERLAAYPNVAGFGSMNEPGEGFIVSRHSGSEKRFMLPGWRRAMEAFARGGGCHYREHIEVKGGRMRSVEGFSLGTACTGRGKGWKACIWRRVGIWDIEHGEAVLKKPQWFARAGIGSNEASSSQNPRFHRIFNQRYLKPFTAKFAARIGSVAGNMNRFMIFVESSPLGEMPAFTDASLETPPQETGNAPEVSTLVNETHWYDSLTLTLKRWTGFLAYDSTLQKVIIGPRAVRRNFREALARIVRYSRDFMGNAPTLLGEFGLPFDLNGRKAFRSGDFGVHQRALSANYEALDANHLKLNSLELTADNTHAHGDGRNGEDLSVFW
jgi:hypothetical protein